jgi:hypothetical protein
VIRTARPRSGVRRAATTRWLCAFASPARGPSIFKMMDQSRHRSVETLRGYVRDAEIFKARGRRPAVIVSRDKTSSQA